MHASLASDGCFLRLEIGKSVTVDGKQVYDSLTDEEYIEKAAGAAKKLSDMIESVKKGDKIK